MNEVAMPGLPYYAIISNVLLFTYNDGRDLLRAGRGGLFTMQTRGWLPADNPLSARYAPLFQHNKQGLVDHLFFANFLRVKTYSKYGIK